MAINFDYNPLKVDIRKVNVLARWYNAELSYIELDCSYKASKLKASEKRLERQLKERVLITQLNKDERDLLNLIIGENYTWYASRH